MSNKVVKLEFADDEFVEIELKSSETSSGGGLGGLGGIKDFSKQVYDKSLSKMVSFLNETGYKIKESFDKTKVQEISISVGIAFSVEGNFIITNSSAESNLTLTVTIKGDD